LIRRLVVENLAVVRGGRRLIDGLAFAVAAGEALVVTGANGSGKTSLLRTLAGLSLAASGSVAFWSAAGALDPEAARAEGLHLLGHKDGLHSGRTAQEELAFWSGWQGGGRALAGAVEAMDLGAVLNLPVAVLSAGQRRRLALARLLAAPRPLWLLDEPMAPLDQTHRARFAAVMAAHLAEDGLILAASHDPFPLSHRVLELGAA
jgi:heme exporter protein A